MVKWDTTLSDHPIITNEMIQEVEEKIGFTFPDDFKVVVRENNEGVPEKDVIQVGDSKEMFQTLFSLHPEDDTYLYEEWQILQSEHHVPPVIVPIGCDPGGNYFCYDFRKESPEIIFFSVDFMGDDPKAYDFVSHSFSDLLHRLKEE
jgi:hypothetical protein